MNEFDLIKSIEDGHLYGACLDVFKVEPLPEDSVLRNQNKVKLTPHIAGGIFPEAQAEYALDVIDSFFNQKKVDGIVNRETRY